MLVIGLTVDSSAKRILIVDDNLRIRTSLRILLEESYIVITAENGAEALSILQETNFIDLAITDIQMPIMTGIELIEEMNRRNIKTPICVTSGAIDYSIITKLENLGCSDILEKPYTENELFQKINIIMSRSYSSTF